MRLDFLVYLIFSASCAFGASQPDSACNPIHAKAFDRDVVVLGQPSEKIHFYGKSQDALESKNQLATFVIPGDLVLQASNQGSSEFQNGPQSGAVCASFRKREGKSTVGWLNRKHLGELHEDFSKNAKEIAETLARNSKREWPAKVTKITPVWGSANPDFDIASMRASKDTEEGPGFLRHKPVDKSDCGILVYHLNNAIAVYAESHNSCWGNHGQTDPSGVYQ